MRPDDLAATVVRAALDQVPQLDPEAIDDLLLGCGQPGGESGFNLARVVAVRLGYDHLPGATITRYCSSSLQTTRMAMHAIRAGEGDVFISAGVETVSRAVKGNSDTLPDTENPVFADAKARTATAAAGGGPVWHDPREDGALPDVYIAMGQTAENVAALRGVTRAEQDEFAVRSQNLAEQAIKDGFYAREITPVTLPNGTVVDTDDGPRPGVTLEALSQLKPVFRPDGTVTAGNCCPLNDGAAALVVMSERKARELGIDPAGPGRRDRSVRALARDHGTRSGAGVPARTGERRHDRSMTSIWWRSTRRSRRRSSRPTGTWGSTWTG